MHRKNAQIAALRISLEATTTMLVLVQDTWECIKTVTVLSGVRQGFFQVSGFSGQRQDGQTIITENKKKRSWSVSDSV